MRPTTVRLFSSSAPLNRHVPAFVSSKTHTVPFWKVPGKQFKRGQEGLFGGARVLSGNTVPHSMHKTRRKWYPNEQPKSLYSEMLGCMVRVKLTSRVLRSIDKMGGFDHYIQNTSAKELGDEGIKWRIILEQYIENGRKPIHPPPTASAEEPIASTSAESGSTGKLSFFTDPTSFPSLVAGASKPQLPPKEQAEPEHSPSASASASAPENPSPRTSTLPSEDGLLFAREARKRATSSVPRIPVFSRALQRSFVQQNVHKSILAARGHDVGYKRMGETSSRENLGAS